VPDVTTAYKIGLNWAAPVFNGGSPLIDYSIWFDNASGSTFTQLVSGLTSLSYTASSLTPGLTYQFKVQARNLYGFSEFSSTVSILAAQIPDAPTLLANVPTITNGY